MAWPPGKHIEKVILRAKEYLKEVKITRKDCSQSRAIINLEGKYGENRIIISEIHRQDGSVRYAYYCLDHNNNLICGFDNSPDIKAIKKQFQNDWKSHVHENIPHKHSSNNSGIELTQFITLEKFIKLMLIT